MKNSVNNKSFDEIFAQRGEQVQPESMVEGRVYFSADEGNQDLNAIIQIQAWQPSNRDFYTTYILWGDGDFWAAGKALFGGESTFYEATPDQIELLNSYRV